MTADAATLTACIVLHESSPSLDGLLGSLRAQTRMPARWVFCLNGADDGQMAELESLPERPIVIHRPENPGFSAGVNACVAVATTTHVALLNPDVEIESTYLEACLAVFAEESDVAGVAGQLLRPEDEDGGRVDTAGFVAQPWLRIVDRASGSAVTDTFTERESVVGVCAAAAVFDREALLQVAEEGRVMDEDFWMYKEDQDLCLRLRESGMRLIFEPRATGHHGRGWAPERRGRVPVKLRRHSLKNRYLILIKHWRWREHGWMLPFVVGFEIFLFCGLMLREPRTLPGYVLALRLVPRMLMKRRKILARERARRADDAVRRPAIPVLA